MGLKIQITLNPSTLFRNLSILIQRDIMFQLKRKKGMPISLGQNWASIAGLWWVQTIIHQTLKTLHLSHQIFLQIYTNLHPLPSIDNHDRLYHQIQYWYFLQVVPFATVIILSLCFNIRNNALHRRIEGSQFFLNVVFISWNTFRLIAGIQNNGGINRTILFVWIRTKYGKMSYIMFGLSFIILFL